MKKYILLIASVFIQINVWAQCAMCTKTAAGLDDNKAGGLNVAIVYLAFIPLIIVLVGGFLYWRYTGKKKFTFDQ